MEYRRLGRTGLDVGVIGLGTEHLEQSRQNMEEVLRTAVDAGINYIDLLYSDPEGSPGFWDNMGPVLERYRDQLVLAAHWGPSHIDEPDRCQRCLDQVLERVGNGYVEVVILAVVDTEKQWKGWAQEALQRLLRYREQGRIGHIGLSGHFVPTVVKAVGSGLIDVLMYGINLVARANQDLDALYRACAEQKVGLVAMKPYYGGSLLHAGGKPTGITPAQCLGYVLSQPVATAVPGARNAEELRATLHYAEATEGEKDYSVVVDIHHYLAGQCVYCGHCHPCPQKINVAGVIWLVDLAEGGVTKELRAMYARHKRKASKCNECGVCLDRCAFQVDAIAKMRRAVELFEGK